MVLYLIFKVLHILSAATWLGSGLTASGDVHRTLALGRPHVDSLVSRLKRGSMLAIITGQLTLWTGVAVILSAGGFSAVPPRILAGAGVTVVMFLFGGMAIRPTGQAIMKVIEGGGDLSAAAPYARRLSMLAGIQHLLWLVVLVLMVVPFHS